MPLTYLDWAATAPVSAESLDALVGAARLYPANPSSLHADGKAAREAFESARKRVAAALGCPADRLCFTSGGTESDGIVLLSLLRRGNPGALVLSSIEHPAVFEQAAVLEKLGWKVRRVDPEPDGRVSPERIADAASDGAAMAAVMAVNNETGAIQPIADIRKALDEASAGRRRVRLHVDAVQALGKIPFDPDSCGADSAAVSAHKIRGPRGIGALYLRAPLEPLAVGGGQERGLRSGTENLPGALAFARAAEMATESLSESAAAAARLTDRLLVGLNDIPDVRPVPDCRVPGDKRYSPWILSIALPGLPGETAVRLLSDRGFAVSTGSACSASRRKRRILEAMGVPADIAFSTIRVSLGPTTTQDEIDSFAQAMRDAYLRYRT